MVADRAPTVRRRRLGAELRRLRNAAGLSLAVVAEQLDCQQSKVSRIETGKIGVRKPDLMAMLGIYGVTDPDLIENMARVAKEGRHLGWWSPFTQALNPGFGDFVALEDEATAIRTFEVTYIPGLLQTETYARDVSLGGQPDATEDQVAQWIKVRMGRQAALNKPGFTLWAVVAEAALRNRVVEGHVMRDQLNVLVEAARRPNVDLQVLPLDSSSYVGTAGAFHLLSFGTDEKDVAYQDVVHSTVFVESEPEVARYAYIFDRLRAGALPPQDSVKLIQQIAKGL